MSPHVTGTAPALHPSALCTPGPAPSPPAPRHVTCTTPTRRLCVHRSALAPICRPDVRVTPPVGTHVSTPDLCGAQLGHGARSDYNSMDDWGECHAGDRYRRQRAPARIACLSPEYMLSGNPPHRSVCPRNCVPLACYRTLVRMLNEPFMHACACACACAGACTCTCACTVKHAHHRRTLTAVQLVARLRVARLPQHTAGGC